MPRVQVPSLMDELVEEILLRLAPDDPGSLLNATLVCKAWCRLVSGPGFNRRFREFHHRTPPPVLGFFCGILKPSDHYLCPSESRFVPLTSSFRRLPHAFMPNWGALDARHGLILFYDKDMVVIQPDESVKLHLIVWNPITGEASRLPVVPVHTSMVGWNAALLCNLVDSGQSAFRVVVVASTDEGTSASVYSSEQHVWSTISTKRPRRLRLLRLRNALIGNALYFRCDYGLILEYDMIKQELSLISLPSQFEREFFTLMKAEDGGLGFAVVCYSELSTWSREVGLDGDNRWAQQGVFRLDNLLPISSFTIVAAVENALSVVFIVTCTGIFIVDLKSGSVRKTYERPADGSHIVDIVPYASFCTPSACLIPHETRCN